MKASSGLGISSQTLSQLRLRGGGTPGKISDAGVAPRAGASPIALGEHESHHHRVEPALHDEERVFFWVATQYGWRE